MLVAIQLKKETDNISGNEVDEELNILQKKGKI
jgi:hypothetical protein